jgi:hypothetical protein
VCDGPLPLELDVGAGGPLSEVGALVAVMRDELARELC